MRRAPSEVNTERGRKQYANPWSIIVYFFDRRPKSPYNCEVAPYILGDTPYNCKVSTSIAFIYVYFSHKRCFHSSHQKSLLQIVKGFSNVERIIKYVSYLLGQHIDQILLLLINLKQQQLLLMSNYLHMLF